MQAKGLDAQLNSLKLYCEQKGITDYLVYQDFGVSGSKASRPGLDSMLAQARVGNISQVIVYSFSRFARSLKHLILALEEFQSLGISFVSITESMDLSTPLGKTVFSIIASIAELEREMIRDRVRNGLKAAKARGKSLGQPRKHVNSLPFIELRNSGMTIRQIAKTLNCSTATVIRILKTDTLTPVSVTNETFSKTNVNENMKSDLSDIYSQQVSLSPNNQNTISATKVSPDK